MSNVLHSSLSGAELHAPFSYGAEPWIDSRAYATLALANSAAYAAGKLLIIAQNHTLTADTVLTAVTKILPGGGFTKASSYTLTINGPFEAGFHTIFTSFTGTVVAPDIIFGAGAIMEIHPEWWGAKPDNATDSAGPLQRALDCAGKIAGIVTLSNGIYLISTALNINGKLTLQGQGYGYVSRVGNIGYATLIKKTTNNVGILFPDLKGDYSSLRNFSLTASGGDASDGIQIGQQSGTNGVTGVELTNIWIQGVGGNGLSVFNGNSGRIHNVTAYANSGHGIQLLNKHTSADNVNAWTVYGLHSTENTGDGLNVGLGCHVNKFLGFWIEGNHQRGLYVGASENIFIGHLDTGKQAGGIKDVEMGGSAFANVVILSCTGHTYTPNFANFWLNQDGRAHLPYIDPNTGIITSLNDVHMDNGARLIGEYSLGSGVTYTLPNHNTTTYADTGTAIDSNLHLTNVGSNFVAAGIKEGMLITPSGFVQAGNNLTRVVNTVTANTITFTSTSGLVQEGAGNTITLVFGYDELSFSGDNIVNRTTKSKGFVHSNLTEISASHFTIDATWGAGATIDVYPSHNQFSFIFSVTAGTAPSGYPNVRFVPPNTFAGFPVPVVSFAGGSISVAPIVAVVPDYNPGDPPAWKIYMYRIPTVGENAVFNVVFQE